jgi:WD40 repeat protein
MKKCPTNQYLEAFLAEHLGPEECETLEEHLAEYVRCQQRLHERTNESVPEHWRELLSHRHDSQDGAEPACFARLASLSLEQVADGDPGSAPAALPKVPGYEMFGELSRGGMGVVYKARQIGLNRLVALKMILAGVHASKEEIARFQREAEAVARLVHPHIVQIHEVGEHAGRPFFSLEYVEGGTLAQHLDGTPLPARQAAELTQTLARAIDYAHQQGIVHRDLTPNNVLVTADGTPKITDFGLAKFLIRGEASPTRTGSILGTPSYMAPEQAQANKQAICPATDVYALGAIMYELLTGRPPFKAETPLDTALQVIHEEPVPPGRLHAKVPHDLETICLKCLYKEPSRRYASAEALAEDLRRFLSGQTILARPVGHAEWLGRWCKRNPVVASLTAAVAVLLVAVAVVSLVGYVQTALALKREEAQRVVTEAAESKAQGKAERALRLWYAGSINLAQQAWENNDIPRVRAVLEETADYPDRCFEWYYLQRLCHLELQTLIGHRSRISGVCWSPDGQRLATASWDGTAKVWDTASGRELLNLSGHVGGVFSVSWSSQGQRLATGSCDTTAKVWDAVSGRELLTLRGHKHIVGFVSWSPDGKRLATASLDGTVNVWETGSDQQPLALPGHRMAVWRLSWSPDGKRLATASQDGTAKIWEVAREREPLTILRHPRQVFSAFWSPDGQRLATGGEDGTAKIWDAASGRELLTFRGHTDWVGPVSWSPDGQWLATGSGDGTAKIWDTARGRELQTIKGHTNGIMAVSWSPDGQRLATGCIDGTAKLWKVSDLPEPLTFKGHTKKIHSISWSPDGQRLATGSEDGTVKVWEAAGGRELLTLKGHTSSILCVSWSPDGQRLVAGSLDEPAKVWETTSGRELLTFQGHTDGVRCVSWSSDGRWLATGSADGRAKICEASSGRELLTLAGHRGPVSSISWSPDGERLATGSFDGTATICEVASGRELPLFPGHAKPIESVCWSPNGQQLATVSDDRTTKIWDASNGQELLTLLGHRSGIFAVSWSPDGRRLATGSYDGTAKVWDASSGRELLTLRGHTSMVRSVSWSPDGRRLATASWDGTAKVWEAATVEAVQEWAGQEHAVIDLTDNTLSRSQGHGFIQDWLLLAPLPLASGETGAFGLERQQISDEAQLRPRAQELVPVDAQQLVWRPVRSPNALFDFNSVVGRETERSVAYLVCYLESDRDRNDLSIRLDYVQWAKVYLNGQEVYQSRAPNLPDGLEKISPVALRQGLNVLIFKVVNEVGDTWTGSLRLVDANGRPAEGIRVKLTP